jgi:hypothetical protein
MLNGAEQNVGFDLFSIFLRFEISKNFSYDDRVIEVSVIEVHIRQEDGQ